MTLGALIAELKKHDPAAVLRDGFARPHSYWGDYARLAFEPSVNVSIGSMLACAEDADGRTFEGPKGGTFRMSALTPVYLAWYGEVGEPIESKRLAAMLAAKAPVAKVPQRSEGTADIFISIQKPMTVDDVLAECPIGRGYQSTTDLCWFTGQKSPIDEEQRILARRMSSVYMGVPDVWVAVPVVHLPTAAPAAPPVTTDTCDGRHWAGYLFPPAWGNGTAWRIPNGGAGAPEIKYCPECGKRLAVQA
jgi:hypothetical protein